MDSVKNGSAPLIRWSAVFSGVVVALGVLAALYALGASLGMATLNVEIPGRARQAGILLGAFGTAAPFLALFAGGLVAGAGAESPTKSVGFLHGLTVWGLSAIALVWLTYASVSAATSGIATVGKGAAQAAGSVLQAGGSALSEGFGGLEELAKEVKKEAETQVTVDSDTALQAVNKVLEKRGHKPVERADLERALKRIGRDAMKKQKLDRAMVVQAVTEETSVNRSDIESVADDLTQRFNSAEAEMKERVEEAKHKLEQAREQAKQKLEEAANTAAEAASKAFGALFLALALGLAAAGGGAALTSARRA